MRRIKKAKIEFISLCPKGMNQMPTLYKADGTFAFDLLTKASEQFDEQGELLAVVYAPEIPDKEGDIASADVVKDMAHDFLRCGGKLDIRHDNKPLPDERAYVAESFLVQKGDARFADFKDYNEKPVDVTGAWAVVIKINDPDLRKQYREGKWQGVSMGGRAAVETEKTDNHEDDMTPEQLTEVLKQNREATASAIETAVQKAVAPLLPKKEGEDKTKDKPIFKGEPTPENLRKFRLELRKASVLADIDWSSDESVQKAETTLAEIEAALAEIEKACKKGKVKKEDDDEAGVEDDDSDEVKGLKRQLAKAQQRSQQPSNDDGDAEAPMGVGLRKTDIDLMKAGRAHGQAINRMRGYGTEK